MFFLIISLILILFTYSFKPDFFDVFKTNSVIFTEATYSIYCLNIPSDLQYCDIINNGNGYIINTNINNVKYIKSKISNILGESVRFKTTLNKINEVIKLYNLNIIQEEKIDNIVCVYGYSNSNDLTNSIIIDNKKVNMQIAFYNDFITIGTPIILGDY